MASRNWTKEQLDAITARGGTVLVSAAAGSGKTAVLVERVIQRILDPIAPVDADRLLIVTFSKAAAQEMKQRIGLKLSQLIEENPQDAALARQQSLLARAQISTIHSFCQELLRQNFQALDLPPDFRVGDEKELDLLRDDAVAEVIEECYQNPGDSAFFSLVELLSTGRDDKRLTQTVLRLYDFVRSHPFYRDWLADKLAFYGSGLPVEETVWGKVILAYGKNALEYAAFTLEEALWEIRSDEKMEAAYGSAYESDLQGVRAALERVEAGDWDGVKTILDGFSFSRLKALRGFSDDPLKERVQAARKQVKDLIEALAEKQFCATRAQFREDIDDLLPKITRLFELTLAFDHRFAEKKREGRLVDFSDLEHLALALLWEKDEKGYHPSALAKQAAQRFEEVFVDEYQDTNEAQDMLFRAVSRQEKNLFLVGDVKQSIYRFRQAMPEIFLEKKGRFSPYDGKHFPAKILLGRNFRSRPEVTAGINFLFSMVMSEEIGEMDYTSEEALIPAASYPESPGMGWQVRVLDSSQLGEEDGVALEAEYVAAQIARMLGDGTLVTDGGELRPVRPGDIAILLRSTKNKAEKYLEALRRKKIPGWADSQGGFLARREIAAVVSLLRAVDNPLLDVDLTAAMLSPLFGFTADELTQLRLSAPKASIYEAAIAYSGTSEKTARFLETLAYLRREAAVLPAQELVQKVYDCTGFELIAGAMPGGARRKENLRAFLSYAAEYGGGKGLAGFIRFLDRLARQGEDLAPPTGSGGEDAVQILSIHRSKGLEFPVVFLCDTAKQFNKEDLRSSTLLHSQMGFACMRRDEQLMRQFTTVPMEAMKIELERSMLSEELRILYVALTRAKERLIVTMQLPNPEKKLSALAGGLDKGGRVPSRRVRAGNSYADWLLMALLHHQDSGDLCRLAGCEVSGGDGSSHFSIEVESLLPREESGAEEGGRMESQPDPGMVETLRRQSAFQYPNRAATLIPTKMAVSSISKGQGEGNYFVRRPKFLIGKGLTGAERGNAVHKFMQFASYEAARDNPAGEIARLVEQGFLLPAEGEAIPVAKLERFFHSDLARRIFCADQVLREYRFLAEAGEELLAPYLDWNFEGNKTAVQGVADCILVENGRGTVIDYKTDYVKNPQELVGRYRVQVILYQKILEESLHIPIGECILYSFALDEAIPVSLGDLCGESAETL